MARLVKSLVTLRAQVDAIAPGRSKVADGWIGDAAHSSRTSDHNPDSRGLVHAIDITDDAAGGMDALWLREQLRQHRDPRVKYVISEGQIFSSTVSPWQWRPYAGPNGHFHHVHVSVLARGEDDTMPWTLVPRIIKGGGSSAPGKRPAPAPAPQSTAPAFPLRKTGYFGHGGVLRHSGIAVWQRQMVRRGWRLTVDGKWGPQSDRALRLIQQQFFGKADGKLGPLTWAKTWTAPIT